MQQGMSTKKWWQVPVGKNEKEGEEKRRKGAS